MPQPGFEYTPLDYSFPDPFGNDPLYSPPAGFKPSGRGGGYGGGSPWEQAGSSILRSGGRKVFDKLFDGGQMPEAASLGVGGILGGLASSEAATASMALAPGSQLGSLPSVAEWASTGATGGSGIPWGTIGKGAGVIGGGLLGYQGVKEGNEEKGGLGGAIAGWSFGGPIGAVIGATIGGIGAMFNKDKSDLSDKFEDRLGAIAKGDYNEANMKELDGLFEKQAESISSMAPDLAQNIREFRQELNLVNSDNFDEKTLLDYGTDLLENYFDYIERGAFKFDSDANQYATSVLSVLESFGDVSALRDRLNDFY